MAGKPFQQSCCNVTREVTPNTCSPGIDPRFPDSFRFRSQIYLAPALLYPDSITLPLVTPLSPPSALLTCVAGAGRGSAHNSSVVVRTVVGATTSPPAHSSSWPPALQRPSPSCQGRGGRSEKKSKLCISGEGSIPRSLWCRHIGNAEFFCRNFHVGGNWQAS